MDPFIICDASSFLEQWSYQKKPNWFSLANRPLDVGLEQVVLLRRRLLYSEAKKKYGYQLLLRDPIHQFIGACGHIDDLQDLRPYIRNLIRADGSAFERLVAKRAAGSAKIVTKK